MGGNGWCSDDCRLSGQRNDEPKPGKRIADDFEAIAKRMLEIEAERG